MEDERAFRSPRPQLGELSRADISRANLSKADLSKADLSGAYLVRANLYEANLNGANLREAESPCVPRQKLPSWWTNAPTGEKVNVWKGSASISLR
jgi:Pentapeptide repeats (8 copies)